MEPMDRRRECLHGAKRREKRELTVRKLKPARLSKPKRFVVITSPCKRTLSKPPDGGAAGNPCHCVCYSTVSVTWAGGCSRHSLRCHRSTAGSSSSIIIAAVLSILADYTVTTYKMAYPPNMHTISLHDVTLKNMGRHYCTSLQCACLSFGIAEICGTTNTPNSDGYSICNRDKDEADQAVCECQSTHMDRHNQTSPTRKCLSRQVGHIVVAFSQSGLQVTYTFQDHNTGHILQSITI